MSQSGLSLSVRINGGQFMRKTLLLALIAVGPVVLLGHDVASAQATPAPTSSIYAVKFVCGRQAPTNVKPPVEPPVKPGNYATKVNVELLSPSPANGGPVGKWNVSLGGDGLSTSAPVALTQLQTIDFTCAEIVRLASASPNVPPLGPFINGYVNVIANPGVQLAVTGVYTSQGCAFAQIPGTTVAPSLCSGPVSIDVVPEAAVPFQSPPTAED
jgi:hypothetical protein